ncbi:glycine--tRNA ligase subunit beta [Campylobacter fetus]|uniref:glycine--tRNA ligase subunit beta n=1 Tax=Campylobacter fetus TaxID=196 RepID=UPI000818BD02|nr:glycine--tRNA ligase subunit beta [Campylobacter fetus]OCR93481.1 glycyl-tRNA synthetase subunit beta [Campylobacter fetus subsp. testudinum]OCS01326.1 glycine--tRNA ligase subunit beta [Campylobacter fetus subsp. testudinum]
MELLIEIGVEELPAIPFLKELNNIKPKWKQVLDEYGLDSKFNLEYTPRRIVINGDIPELTPDLEAENIGAPKSVALQDGKWSAAALGFAKKCGISQDELSFKEIKGKEVLYHKSVIKGKLVSDLLPAMIEKFILSLNFGKSMRWGSGEYEFIRPIRSLISILGEKSVDFEIFGVRSKKAFYPHRNFGYDMIDFSTIDEYFELLQKNGIILSATQRKEKILNEFKDIEAKNSLKIELDFDLLDEVVAITEYPTALLGSFEKEFLEVPSEVIITSMKENQRYFPLHDADEKLSNHFVVVSNAITNDPNLIIRGNEKVLRARLSDAKFFWHSDLANEFSSEKLKNITYLNELGSMYDKELRERQIVRVLSSIYDKDLRYEFGGDYADELDRAVMLSKADLTTNMVYEFTNLQGVMGGYYAAYRDENPFIISAIKEQYLPNANLYPKTLFSSLVAISNKLDTLMGLFSIGKIPSGNKDPYALRRAASGIIKIVLNLGINFDLRNILNLIKPNYKSFDLNSLESFVYERLYSIYDVNPSVIKACLNSSQSDLKRLNSAIIALDEICKMEDFKDNFSTFKRLSNIIKDSEIIEVDESLFEENVENELNNKFKTLNLNIDDTKTYLEGLFGLKTSIDLFFDSVMINHDNPKIKANRISIIGQIYKAFLKVADIKEISA